VTPWSTSHEPKHILAACEGLKQKCVISLSAIIFHFFTASIGKFTLGSSTTGATILQIISGFQPHVSQDLNAETELTALYTLRMA